MLKMPRLVAIVTASVVLAALLAPLGPAGGARRQQGDTATSIDVLSVELTRVPALGRLKAALGVAAGNATTIDKPLAGVLLNAIQIGNQTVGSHKVTSEGGTGSATVNVPLNAPGIDGSVTVAELRAEATADSALAVLSALEGNIDIGPLGLSAKTGGQGLRSSVDTVRAASTAGLDIGPLDLDLIDLLPAELLENLPLSVLLKLVKKLDLNIKGRLSDAVEELKELTATARDATTTITELAVAQADLDDLLAGNAQIEAAQQAVTDAAAAVADAEAEVAAVQAELDAQQAEADDLRALLDACVVSCALLEAQLDAVNAQIDSKQGELSAAQSDLAAAQAGLADAEAALDALIASIDDAAIAAARDLVSRLEIRLNNLIDRLTGLIGGLPNLSALLHDVLDALRGAPLLSVGRLAVKVESAADDAAGSAAVTCEAGGIEILGKKVGGAGCRALTGAFGRLRDGIFGVLSGLPVAGSVPTVTVAGLETSESTSDSPDADGYNTGEASITALHLGVPSVELANVVDDAVADLLASVEDLLGTNQATDALATLLTELQVTLQGLPLGDVLADLSTVGLDLKAAGLSSKSRYKASDSATEVLGNTTGTPDERGATDTAPSQLPFTGTGAQLLLMLAIGMWLAAVGALAGVLGERGRLRRNRI